MLSQYIYISTAPNLSREDVDTILDASARNNPKDGITGLLLYNGRNFLQLLEGDAAKLDELMERISGDARHTGVSLLRSDEIAERTCPDWAMQRIAIVESVASRAASIERDLPSNLDPASRSIIMSFAVLN
ncbi:BLUF domain-containing protein [Sulfitobacter sp.]|uniref:BLUF domain-containing protein n=1 Tax=Sulfitobacter sp. TaxID=1903071 RepID=UPI003EF8DE58